jgi:hypothetical protein
LLDRQSSDVAARPRQTCDEAAADWVHCHGRTASTMNSFSRRVSFSQRYFWSSAGER